MDSGVTWHADATECTAFVQTSAVILAGIRIALVDVDLAPGSGESARAVAFERTWRVDAEPVVLARRTRLTLIDIVGTVDSLEPFGTRAHVRSVDGTRVANSTGVTRIRGASVVQMAQQPRFPGCALTEETAHAVVARRTVEASRSGTVVDVLRTVGTGPSVDADARVAAVCVGARGAVLANAGTEGTFIYVLVAVRSRKRRRATTRVTVDAIDASRSVLAQMARTVVQILLAVGTAETDWTATLVVE